MSRRTNYLKCSRKYDVPLFCASWASTKADSAHGDLVLFGGGGGDRKHGVKNRLLLASTKLIPNVLLDNQVAEIDTEDDAPFRCAVDPGGDGIVASFSNDCRLFSLRLGDNDEDGPSISASRTSLPVLQGVGEQKCLVFSTDGSHLAAGGEDGHLRVMKWPSLEVVLDVPKAHSTSIKDLDFSLEGDMVASTADAGPCKVWKLTESSPIATLEFAAGGRFGFCRFTRVDAMPFLYITIVRKTGGFVAVYNVPDWKLLGAKKLHEEPISAFAASPCGKHLATGSAAGDVAIVDIKTMIIKRKVKSAHMVFITAVQFSPSGWSVLSVSADSSARVTQVPINKSMPEWKAWLILAAMFLGSIILFGLFYVMYSDTFFALPKDTPAIPSWFTWSTPSPVANLPASTTADTGNLAKEPDNLLKVMVGDASLLHRQAHCVLPFLGCLAPLHLPNKAKAQFQ
eukprot:SM000007S20892  [mRNA]  locus=s7:772262:778125:- [translate_table: standard]